MNRVSTAGNYQSALLNLMASQNQLADGQNRLSTQKVATDMEGFGRGAESLTALKASQSRLQGFIDTGTVVADRLESQDLALNQVGDAVGGARATIAGALATENINTLMLELQGQFQSVQNGLNTQHQGNYLFAGSDTTKAPVSVSTMAELAAAPSVASTFTNDNLPQTSRLGEATTVRTGYLASDVGTTIFQIFKDIQAYSDDPTTGPLTGKPNDAQKAFLTAQISRLDAASASTIDVIARNGSLAKQVETTNASHVAQESQLDEMVHTKTDADLAKAVTDIQLAQLAVQASAQVITQLKDVSLLNYLR